MWPRNSLLFLSLITTATAVTNGDKSHDKNRDRDDEHNHDKQKNNEDPEEAIFFNRKNHDSLPSTSAATRAVKGEVVVEKFVETLMSSERYLKMIESVERKVNHLDATFHERTNSILKYVSEMLRTMKTGPDLMESTLWSIKTDLDKLKTSVTERFNRPTMRELEFMRNATGAPWYLRNANLHIDLRLPTIAQFMKQASRKYFDSAPHHPNPLVVAASNYDPLREHPHRVRRTRRLREVLNDPGNNFTPLTSVVEFFS